MKQHRPHVLCLLCLLSQQSYSKCPPTGQGGPWWPLSDMASLPLAAGGQRKGGQELALECVLCDRNKSPRTTGPGSLPATVPADIHVCSRLPAARLPGQEQRSSPGSPTPGGASSTHRPRPPTSAPDTRPILCSDQKQPQSQRETEAPPQKPTCEGADPPRPVPGQTRLPAARAWLPAGRHQHKGTLRAGWDSGPRWPLNMATSQGA